MKTYTLRSNKKTIINDSLDMVMKQLMKISSEVGNVPKVEYNYHKEAVEFCFEGEYCDFSLYLSE